MRATIRSMVFLAVTLAAPPALAWDGPQSWYGPADGASPGGGGILGTGGSHDHGIKCSDCHVEREQEVLDLELQFQPAMSMAGPDYVYSPGQRYRVDVRLLGAALGPPCDPYMKNVDNFAASFETDAGAPAGSLESDSGQSTSNCPAAFPDPASVSGTTGLASDCEVVFGLGLENVTMWTFYWTAPSSGTIQLHFGGVDGDCDMMSMGDAEVSGSRVLRAPMSVAPPRRPPAPGSPWRYALFAAIGLVALPISRRRRRR